MPINPITSGSSILLSCSSCTFPTSSAPDAEPAPCCPHCAILLTLVAAMPLSLGGIFHDLLSPIPIAPSSGSSFLLSTFSLILHVSLLPLLLPCGNSSWLLILPFLSPSLITSFVRASMCLPGLCPIFTKCLHKHINMIMQLLRILKSKTK